MFASWEEEIIKILTKQRTTGRSQQMLSQYPFLIHWIGEHSGNSKQKRL